MSIYEKLENCLKSLREKTDFKPRIGIVLGSGLGEFGKSIQIEKTVLYSDIEGFPTSTAPGHKGQFIFGKIESVPVVLMQGRVHFYEGYAVEDLVLPVRLMGLMGIETLILTNAAGAVNHNFKAGDLMLINDHISSFVPSPLIGKNIEKLGVRFPDMTRIYDANIREIIKNVAKVENISLREGVYLQVTGPQFETPTEIKAYRMMGADAAGMSTAIEAIAARHMGIKVCGISLMSNMAAGMTGALLSAEEVFETANVSAKIFEILVKKSVVEIAKI